MVDGFAPKRYADADDTIYSVSQKSPVRFSDIFSQTVGNI